MVKNIFALNKYLILGISILCRYYVPKCLYMSQNMEYKIFSKLQPYVKHLFETNIGELEYLLVEDFLLKFLHFANKTHHMCRLM